MAETESEELEFEAGKALGSPDAPTGEQWVPMQTDANGVLQVDGVP